MSNGKLGSRLRELRLGRGLSVRTLAARTGFSPSFISQVEADQASPSIASLEKIAVQLGVTLGQLFSSLESSPRVLVRANERVSYNSAWSRSIVEALTDEAADRKLSAVQVIVEPEGSSGRKVAASLEDTFALILSGSIKLTTEHDVWDLQVGDAAYFQEGDVYMWENSSQEQATLLLVNVAGRINPLSSFVALKREEDI